MNPLNTFPFLLDFVRFSPFILRVVVALTLITLGRMRLQKSMPIASVPYFIFGTALLLGFYTQISSIVYIIILMADFHFEFW